MEPSEMRRHRFDLDETTADGLAAGRVAPADAPPGYAAAAGLLTAARNDLETAEIDPQLLTAMVQAIDTQPTTADRKATMPSKARSTKVGVLAAALVLSTAGAAAAATGNLPDPAQDALSKAAEKVGFDLPASNDDHTTGNADNGTDADEHGEQVSETARNTEPGPGHGQAVSEVARAGHGADEADDEADDEVTEQGAPEDPGSQAGEHANEHAADGLSRADARGGNADDHPTPDDHPTADDNPGTAHRP
jgi:hypothetical protein